jgi:hypothetical protein
MDIRSKMHGRGGAGVRGAVGAGAGAGGSGVETSVNETLLGGHPSPDDGDDDHDNDNDDDKAWGLRTTCTRPNVESTSSVRATLRLHP